MLTSPKGTTCPCWYSCGLLCLVLIGETGPLREPPKASVLLQALGGLCHTSTTKLGTRNHLLRPLLPAQLSALPCFFLTTKFVVCGGRNSLSLDTASNLAHGGRGSENEYILFMDLGFKKILEYLFTHTYTYS